VLHFYEALTYIDLEQSKDAWKVLSAVDGLHPKMPTSTSMWIEFLNLQAKTAAELGDMELSTTSLRASVHASSQQGYNLWLSEAYDIYHEIVRRWPHEPKIEALSDLFHGLSRNSPT
jgi:hypothetical protein